MDVNGCECGWGEHKPTTQRKNKGWWLSLLPEKWKLGFGIVWPFSTANC